VQSQADARATPRRADYAIAPSRLLAAVDVRRYFFGVADDVRNNALRGRRLRDVEELVARERAARRQLEEEKVARERLVAAMAQEVLCQANVICGWVDLLCREPFDSNTRKRALEKVHRAARAQASCVHALVGIDAIAAGHLMVDRRRVDLVALLRAVVGDLGRDDVEVTGVTMLIVLADAEHIVRALRALLEAAVRSSTSPLRAHAESSATSANIRVSNMVPDDDDALLVTRTVAAVYDGALLVADGETIFTLPLAERRGG
jgi:hypothetical protein